MGFAQLLQHPKTGPLNVPQEKHVKEILNSGQHLLSLVNDVLDLSKVEAGKMELKPAELYLPDVLHASLVYVKEKALQHNIALSVEVGEGVGTIVADERKVKQILLNLLSNAVKFTPDGGKVGITARLVDDGGWQMANGRLPMADSGDAPSAIIHEPSAVEVTVWDTGIGISPENLERIFRPFEQVENRYIRRFQGTGLGLSLTRQLVEMHGGRIWADSEEGKGSRFAFTLPEKPLTV
jgi:signal transduction histidine kinase